MPGSSFWGQKTCLVVTGASQGIGQFFACELSKLLGANSSVIIIARSVSGLEETRKRILEANPAVKVKVSTPHNAFALQLFHIFFIEFNQ